MDLERLAQELREEQLADPRVVRRSDQDEPEGIGRSCVVCEASLAGRHPLAKICAACVAQGFMASPCPGCGGPRHMRDRNASPRRRGLCGRCRAALDAEKEFS